MRTEFLKKLSRRLLLLGILLSYTLASYAALSLSWTMLYLAGDMIRFRWWLFAISPIYVPVRMLGGPVLHILGFPLFEVMPPLGEFFWLWASYVPSMFFCVSWTFTRKVRAKGRSPRARQGEAELSRSEMLLLKVLAASKIVLWLMLTMIAARGAYRIGETRAVVAVPDIELTYIPAGEFMMGAASSEYDPSNIFGERPQHKVRISKGFYMGVTEVTQAQWKAIMRHNPSKFKGDDLPVESVSWYGAVRFCKKMRRITGKRYRLPTEAEWEYACRAGTQTRFYFGEDPNLLGEYAWWGGNSEKRTHAVGQKKPNAFGLYDMHGNVLEWCSDLFDETYYARSPSVDPENTTSVMFRVLRGGSWSCLYNIDTGSYRCASRNATYGHMRSEFAGFRVVMEAE